jgi:hypothetical protein
MLRQGNGGYELQFIGPTVYETEEEADIDGIAYGQRIRPASARDFASLLVLHFICIYNL